MVSVVIPVYRADNNFALLAAHLEKYKFQTARDFEVIVVNDGCVPALVDDACEKYPSTRVIHLSENSGPAFARNVGAREAKYDRVLFVGDDCFPHNDLVLRHHLHHLRYPNIALQGYSPFHPDIMDTRFMHWLNKSGMQASWQNLQKDGKWVKEAKGYLLTTNWSMHKDDFLRMGGFPEGFPNAAWEDVCFGHTLNRSGYKTYFDPGAVNLHYHKHNIDTFARRSRKEGVSRITLATIYPEFAGTLLGPEDLRGALSAPLVEVQEQAKRLQNVPQANIDDLMRTVMVGNALDAAWGAIQKEGGVMMALPFVANKEFPAYIFSARKAIQQGNDGFVRHSISWAIQKEPSNWATFAFAGECSLAIGEKTDALLHFNKALEMHNHYPFGLDWLLSRLEELGV